VQTYTLPYVEIIRNITKAECYLVTAGKQNRELRETKTNGINLIELPDPLLSGRLQWIKNVRLLSSIVKQKSIDTIHAWCTPAGAIGVLLKKKNIKLIIDSFEPHAEAMVENGTWSRGGLKYRFLSYFEKREAKLADNLIFAADGMQDYVAKTYGVKPANYFVKPACVDLSVFSKAAIKNKSLLAELKLENKLVCVYAGKFGGIYLEDEVFAFIKECENYWGKERFRFLLLSNVSDEYLTAKLVKHGIEKESVVKQFVPHKEVQNYIGLADFALCPVKPVPTKRYCTPIKNAEYWALGLPVIVPHDISTDSERIEKDKAGAVLQHFTTEDYIKAIKQIDGLIANKSREEVYNLVRPLAEQYRSFSIAEKVYGQIYNS
jgi:glycosyltransferase involved in cell wall biosynthesis